MTFREQMFSVCRHLCVFAPLVHFRGELESQWSLIIPSDATSTAEWESAFTCNLASESHQSWRGPLLTSIFPYLSSLGGQVSYLENGSQVSHLPRILLEPLSRVLPQLLAYQDEKAWEVCTGSPGSQHSSSLSKETTTQPYRYSDEHLDKYSVSDASFESQDVIAKPQLTDELRLNPWKTERSHPVFSLRITKPVIIHCSLLLTVQHVNPAGR